jgi:hypothetical protein
VIGPSFVPGLVLAMSEAISTLTVNADRFCWGTP